MRLSGVNFKNWLRGHSGKSRTERWLRELYPWPVLSQVEFSSNLMNQRQTVWHDGIDYGVTLTSIKWQPERGTYRFRVRVIAEGLGWHSRSYSDDYDLCATKEGRFVTLFHTSKREPLERLAKAFFNRNWSDIREDAFKTLSTSRFLAAAIAGQVAEDAFDEFELDHYPNHRLVAGSEPMLASGDRVWIGQRFFSENAYEWARRSAGRASRVIALHFADTKYQFNTALPSGCEVHSVASLASNALGGRHEDLILSLLRGMDLPTMPAAPETLSDIVRGNVVAAPVQPSEADVHEALAALERPCNSVAELRYQLAAGVLLNAWIEAERRIGFVQRKSFYASKQRIRTLAYHALDYFAEDVKVWADSSPTMDSPVLYIRIDGVDFSFHSVPIQDRLEVLLANPLT